MRRASLILVVLLAFHVAWAQSAPSAPIDPEMPSVLIGLPGTPGVPSRLQNLNAAVSLTSIHDSSTGWYTVLTPAVSYSFARRYSADITMPVYLFLLAASQTAPTTDHHAHTTTSPLEPHEFDPADMLLGAHAYFAPGKLSNVFSASMTLPTGDTADGLSTGHVSFDLDSHSQLQVRRTTFILDLGGGDSSMLVNPLVARDYTTLGPLMHFEAGAQFALPLHSLFQTVAYEQLPLGDDKVYTTLSRPGGQSETVVAGRSVDEDNGFSNVLSIPLTPHIALHGYYNRSLRLHLDMAGVGLSFSLRGTQR